jgi:hypothetical protein
MIDDNTLQIQVDLQAAYARIKSDKDPERELIADAVATLRQFMKDQSKVSEAQLSLSYVAK